MSTIAELEDEIREDFALFDDWEERYNYLIDLGKDLPLIDPAQKTEDNLIKGCQSRVWVHATAENGKVFYTADSDAVITKGIISLLVRVMSGQPAEDIVRTELKFIDDIGLKEHLSPTRSNGLVSMIRQMKQKAAQFLTSNH
jgi:cysteine desulfuration protein SufE